METFNLRDYCLNKQYIGKGSFSVVYKGYNSKGETIAIKKINRQLIKNIQKYIKLEIDLMFRLRHPNIIRLYEVFHTKNSIYLVMEYCPHVLNDLIPLSEDKCLFYLKQLSDSLRHLVENKIAHRDLKPQNILITEKGVLKLTDFGFAKTGKHVEEHRDYFKNILHPAMVRSNWLGPEYGNLEGAKVPEWIKKK